MFDFLRRGVRRGPRSAPQQNPASAPAAPQAPWLAPAAPPVPSPGELIASVAGLSRSFGREYGSGYTDADIEAMADEDARASVHDPELWGENADHVRGIDIVNAAHVTNMNLIAMQMREEALPLYHELDRTVTAAKVAERGAIEAIDADLVVQRRHPTWPPDADGVVQAACERHAELVARCNALVTRIGALIAHAGHHIQISASDAVRQGLLYARRVQLNQPEPITRRLLTDRLPQPATMDGEELRRFVIGLSDFPELERLTTDVVTAHRTTAARADANSEPDADEPETWRDEEAS